MRTERTEGTYTNLRWCDRAGEPYLNKQNSGSGDRTTVFRQQTEAGGSHPRSHSDRLGPGRGDPGGTQQALTLRWN